MAYKTGNPALSNKTFKNKQAVDGERMTLNGVVHKSLLLLGITVGTAAISWMLADRIESEPVLFWLVIISTFVGVAIAFLTIAKPERSPITAPIYAGVEGVIVGVVSLMFEREYGGIVLQAVSLTLGIFLAMLLIYRSGLIKVSRNFRLGLAAATGGIMLYYLVSLGARVFGVTMPLIHDSGWGGIIFSLVVVIVASLNLVLDFDFIERGVRQKAAKYMEWYAGFGLLVTLVWLYLELLRLLGKSRRR